MCEHRIINMYYDGCQCAREVVIIERCKSVIHDFCPAPQQAGNAQQFNASKRCLWCREAKAAKKAEKEAKKARK